jgi:two-component system cell cycle response regulator DivK
VESMKKYKILIIEDNPKNMKIMVDLMEVHGYEAATAEDGFTGLETALTEKPDLILMDVQLPGIDGYEVTRRLKGKDATRDIPVIVVTSFAMKGEEARAKEVGAAGYISKPIDIHKLMDAVAEQLNVKDGNSGV